MLRSLAKQNQLFTLYFNKLYAAWAKDKEARLCDVMHMSRDETSGIIALKFRGDGPQAAGAKAEGSEDAGGEERGREI